MFAFDKFPSKIRYERLNSFDEVILEREVEVFGYVVCDSVKPMVFGDYKETTVLVAYREIDFIQAPVSLLPVDEFEKRFEDYNLVKDEKED